MRVHLLSAGIIPRREGKEESPPRGRARGGEDVRLRERWAAFLRFGDEHYTACMILNLIIISVAVVCTAINARVLIGR